MAEAVNTNMLFYFLKKGWLLLLLFPISLQAQQKDTSEVTLENVTITDPRIPGAFRSSIPLQSLNKNIINTLNTFSAADAARLFSGALIKDYGGVGGLKTISVRGLGTAATGITYDGIPVSDLQTGQIDLSRFSTTFLQSVSLYHANPSDILSPARSFASASVLAINSTAFQPLDVSQTNWSAGLNAGSFGLWQPHAGVSVSPAKNTLVSIHGEALFSKGNYPYEVDNGAFSESLKRDNSEVTAFQAEVDLAKMFEDSSLFQIKVQGYDSERGLPGAVVFFNPRSVQRLWNKDIFTQSRYIRPIDKKSKLLLAGKYSYAYTRYTDPDMLNGMGGLDDRYHQQELYFSAAINRNFTENLELAFSTDISQNGLNTNKPDFKKPTRFAMWNNIALKYSYENFLITGSVLNSYFQDKTHSNPKTVQHDKVMPTASVSYQPYSGSPILIRAFYKQSFRMPTFNDLYYNFIGNRNLVPESAGQLNVGFTWSEKQKGKMTRFNFSIDGYLNNIKDKIIAVPGQNLFNWSMLNLGEVIIKGVDVNLETNFSFTPKTNLFFRLGYTGQKALDMTTPGSQTYKNRIPYTPDHSGSSLVIFSFKKWSAGYNLLFSDKRFTQGANTYANLVQGWATLDISLIRALELDSFGMSIKGGITNLTDKQYDVIRYFPMPGRSYTISLTINNL